MSAWLQSDTGKAYFKLIRRLILTALAVYLLFFVAPSIVNHIRPFFFAFIMAFLLNPLISWIQRKTKISRSILSVISVLLVIILLVGIVGGLLFALISELVSLAQNVDAILAFFARTTGNISRGISNLSEYVPFDTHEIVLALNNSLENFLAWFYAQSATMANAAISFSIYGMTGIGNFLVSLIFFLMASYFTMAHFPRIKESLRNTAGSWVYDGLRTFKNTVFSAVGGYLRVQLIMASIISVLSLAAFLIVGQRYAVLLSLLFFVLDFMPLIGVGGLLVPWGIISIFTGEIWYGIFLLGMYVVIFMLHRLIEPKLMGREMGLHPLIALLSLFLGMRFGGVLGLIIAPMIATIIVSFYKAGLFNGLLGDIKAVLNLYGKQDEG